MGFIPCTNVAQLSALYTCGSEPVENVYNYMKPDLSAWTVPQLTALGDQHGNYELLNLLPYRGEHVTYRGCIVRDLTTDSSPEVSSTVGVGTAGGRTAQPLPNNVTFCLKLQTGLVGRSFRGRTYWIGLVYDQITGNTILSSGASDIRSLLNGLISTQHGGFVPADMGVLSRRHNNTPRAVGVFTKGVSFAYTDLVLDSQRRRLPAHNRHH